MGQRIGIIAGSGEFPLLAVVEARRRGFEPTVAAVRGEAEETLRDAIPDAAWFGPGELGGLLGFLKSRGIAEVLIAGKVRPESVLRPGAADPAALRVLELAGGASPSRLIGSLISFLEEQGIRVLDPSPFLAEQFFPPGILTRTRPSSAVLADIDRGFAIARTLADLDAGQTVVVKDGAVVALEGSEGTDRAILRAGDLAGPGTVVVKVARMNQDPRIDLPGAGLRTIRSLIEARAAAFAFEAGKVVLFRKDESVAMADEHGIALVATASPGERRDPRSGT
jgi:UDP-2,3-diacylglucosamine hydrolase